MASPSSKVNLKLLIDRKASKVLFAEAGKDFVDFLFNLLSLPVGTVIRLLNKKSMVGSLGNLYESVENLNETYMQPNLNKDTLLKPTSVSTAGIPLMLTNDQGQAKVYMCASYHRYVADDPKAICPQCNQYMSIEVPFVTPPVNTDLSASGGGGYVKGVVTYMVMDDLVVNPMSTISSITLLNKFNVKEVGALEEKVVHLRMTEGLNLLKASLHTKAVLQVCLSESNKDAVLVSRVLIPASVGRLMCDSVRF